MGRMLDEEGSTQSSPTLFILGIGLVFLAMNIWSFRKAYLLKRDGVTIGGQVLRTYLVKHRGSVTYNTDYAFTASGERHEGSADVTRTTFLTLRPGGPIAIRYVPSYPSLSESADISHSDTTLFLTKYLGIPVSLFILFLAFRKERTQEIEDSSPTNGSNIPLPNTVKGIAYTVYPVTDMSRARQFYEGSLGLRADVDFRGEWVEYHLWDSCFAITSMTKDVVKPSSDSGGSVAFEVQDVDDFVDQLRKKGTPVKVEPFSTRVCRMAVVLDPEGNALTLHAKNHGHN